MSVMVYWELGQQSPANSYKVCRLQLLCIWLLDVVKVQAARRVGIRCWRAVQAVLGAVSLTSV